ncbi:MAG: oligosaccharide repeat unit polymerase [Sulfurovaceae bacterium]|nr:oligosaccharide repeat unit polymerase [Sulfurovaceae bacterium]
MYEIELFYEISLFFVYFVTFILMSWYIVKSVESGWDILSVFFIFFTVQYLFIPLLFILNKTVFFLHFPIGDLIVKYHGLEQFYSFSAFMLTLVFIGFMFAGIWSIPESKTKPYVLEDRMIYLFGEERSLLYLIALFLILLSFASIFLYSNSFGGIARAIEVADNIRSGYGDEFWISKTWVFTKRFIPFSLLGVILFLTLKERTTITPWIMILMGIAVTLISVFGLFRSKQAILSLALVWIYYLSLKNKKNYLFQLMIFFIMAVFLIPLLESVYGSGELKLPEISSFAQQLLEMFSFFNFNAVSLEFALEKNYDFRYFMDYFLGLSGTYLPASWLVGFGIDGESVTINTFYFYGTMTRTVPPGVVAGGYYNLGVLGVVLVAFGTGALFKALDIYFKKIIILNPRFMLLYAFIIVKAFTWTRTGLPKYAFYSTTMTVVLIVMIIGFKKKEI